MALKMPIYFMQQQVQICGSFTRVGYAPRPYKGARGKQTVQAKEACTGWSDEVVGSLLAKQKKMTVGPGRGTGVVGMVGQQR